MSKELLCNFFLNKRSNAIHVYLVKHIDGIFKCQNLIYSPAGNLSVMQEITFDTMEDASRYQHSIFEQRQELLSKVGSSAIQTELV